MKQASNATATATNIAWNIFANSPQPSRSMTIANRGWEKVARVSAVTPGRPRLVW